MLDLVNEFFYKKHCLSVLVIRRQRAPYQWDFVQARAMATMDGPTQPIEPR